MKNNKILFGIICAVALIMVNVVVFTTVKDFNTARCINIGFLNLSVIIALFFTIMFGKKDYKFMNYSRLPIVALYFLLTFLISTIFIICNLKNITVTIVTQIILLGLFIFAMASNTMANNSSENSLEKDTLLKNISDREVYKKVEKAYDDVKSTKINISEDTSQIDSEILQAIAILENNIQNNAYNVIDEQINKIHSLIITRNQMK